MSAFSPRALPFALAALLASTLAATAAQAAQRQLTATGASLDVDGTCARHVSIQPDATLSNRAVVEATADHQEEVDQLAFDSLSAAKLHVPSQVCWRTAKLFSDSPTLGIAIRVPPGFAIAVSEGGGVTYDVGPVGGKLDLDLSGGVTLKAVRATALAIDLSGGGGVSVADVTGSVKGEISGGGTVSVARGAIDDLSLEISGGGTFGLNEGTVGKFTLDQSGGGETNIGATVTDATLEVSGGGSVHIAKVIGTMTKDVSGAGEVEVGQ